MSSAVEARSRAAARSAASRRSRSDNVANDVIAGVMLLSTIVFFRRSGRPERRDPAGEWLRALSAEIAALEVTLTRGPAVAVRGRRENGPRLEIMSSLFFSNSLWMPLFAASTTRVSLRSTAHESSIIELGFSPEPPELRLSTRRRTGRGRLDGGRLARNIAVSRTGARHNRCAKESSVWTELF